VPTEIETHYFRQTRITGYRLKKLADILQIHRSVPMNCGECTFSERKSVILRPNFVPIGLYLFREFRQTRNLMHV
jgi:hypothetical protein